MLGWPVTLQRQNKSDNKVTIFLPDAIDPNTSISTCDNAFRKALHIANGMDISCQYNLSKPLPRAPNHFQDSGHSIDATEQNLSLIHI